MQTPLGFRAIAMDELRLFIDEDSMDRRFVSALRARGLDVVTVGDIETTGSSDGDQLQLATELRRVLYTFNVGDFCQLHNQWMRVQRSHSGIVISSQDYSVGEQMRRVLQLAERRPASTLENQLIFLSSYGAGG